MTEGLEGKTCEKRQTAWGQSFKLKEAEGHKHSCLAEAESMVQAEEECTLAAEEEGKTQQLFRRQLTAMRV